MTNARVGRLACSPGRSFGPLLLALACALLGLLQPVGAHAASWVWVQEGTALEYLEGTATAPAGWTEVDFTPGAGWTASAAGFGIGYGDGDDATVLSTMAGNYLTVYARSHFNVGPELAGLTHVELQVSFDDGFVVYVNGTEVGRSNVPAGALQATTAATAHEVTDGTLTLVVDAALLRTGDNVLAVEVHNSDIGSSDLSFIPRLWGYDTPPVDAVLTRGPFLQQVGRTSALVVWETDVPVPSRLTYGLGDALDLVAEETTPTTRHVVSLSSLAPNRAYSYQVQSAQIPSPLGRFATEVNRADAFLVGVFGDTRSQHDVHRDVATGLASHEPNLAFLTGDLVADGDVAANWDLFCDIESELIRDTALYPCLGNHEGSGQLYLDLFELPPSSPAPERYYTVRYGTVLGIVLDQYGSAYDAGSEQALWLEQVLADSQGDPNIRFRLVFLHHGPYDSGSHGSNMTVRSDLVPLFEQYGVAAVFSGHDHDYERGTVTDVKYVVTGGGGAPLYSVAGDFWTEVSASEYHYCTLAIEGPRLEFTARLRDGSVLDSFALGDDLAECDAAPVTECASFEPAEPCAAGETGAWACVHGACIWNCVAPEPSLPDGGLPDGGGASGAGGDGAGAGSGVGASPPGALPDGSEDDGGCGCRVAGGSAGRLAFWGAGCTLLALGGLRRRRRVRR